MVKKSKSKYRSKSRSGRSTNSASEQDKMDNFLKGIKSNRKSKSRSGRSTNSASEQEKIDNFLKGIKSNRKSNKTKKIRKKITESHKRKISKGLSKYHKKCKYSIGVVNNISKTKKKLQMI